MTITPHSSKLRVLDLFSGLGGWSQAFRERGHDVVRVELDAKFEAEITNDVRNLVPSSFIGYDVVLASPPCEGFTVMQIGRNWNHDHTPKNDRARLALELMLWTVRFIRETRPRYCWVENPVGKMRRLMEIHAAEFPRQTVRVESSVPSRLDLGGGRN